MNPLAIGLPIVAAAGLGISAFAAVNPRSQLFGPTIRHTNYPQKLAITFDDGPNPAITPQLLDLLARHNAKATFFLIGKFVTECPALAKEIVNRGHVVGNHTETHPALAICGPTETQDELRRCSEAILQATWANPRFFRPPYGFRNPWVGGIATRLQMKVAMWTLLPGDWRAPSAEWLIPRLQPIAARAKDNLAGSQRAAPAAGGDILCLHDGSQRAQNTDRTPTLKTLEHWLPRWRDLGLEFVTMDQAMETLVQSHG
jgi:peptidoglycan-N-acetylglucosamine deacetylase